MRVISIKYWLAETAYKTGMCIEFVRFSLRDTWFIVAGELYIVKATFDLTGVWDDRIWINFHFRKSATRID